MTTRPPVYPMFERPARPAQTVTLRVPVPSRRTVSWTLLLIALVLAAGCLGALDQERLTPTLLLSLAPYALSATLATYGALLVRRPMLDEYVDLGGRA